MRKVIVTMWITLDGFVAGPAGEMNWITEIYGQDMGKYETDLLGSADTLILGRETYESFAGAWPHVAENPSVSQGEREYARMLNAMHKVVFSRSLEKVEWNNSRLVRDSMAEEVTRLKQEPGKDILIYGSVSIVQALTELDLIDEYQLLLHPVILGGGKALFQNIANRHDVEILTTKTFDSGVVVLYYQSAKKKAVEEEDKEALPEKEEKHVS